MAKVNLYISNDAYEKINAIIEKRRQEGAREKDVSFSATASMLLELGLRVHEAQMERKESAFNQTECKRLVRTVLIFTESSDQLSRATDRVPGLPASPGYVQ